MEICASLALLPDQSPTASYTPDAVVYTVKNKVCIPNGVINGTPWVGNHPNYSVISTPTMSIITPFGMVCTLHFLQCMLFQLEQPILIGNTG